MNNLTIIIPYRNRASHLEKFMKHMGKYNVVVIEQSDNKPFNRGKLLNIGVIEFDADYYALHDVDMIPVQANYAPPVNPTLLATKVQQFGYKLPFPEYFGGVVLITREHMLQCNGFHNEFWGWGGEDNLFRDRVLATVGNIDHRTGIFNSLPHDRIIQSKLHTKNVNLWKAGPALDNGISNCEYKVVSRDGNHIKVEL